MPKTYFAVVTTIPAPTNSVPTVNCVQEETTTTLLPPKHVRLGVGAVDVINPTNSTTAQVYAFHDSGLTSVCCDGLLQIDLGSLVSIM